MRGLSQVSLGYFGKAYLQPGHRGLSVTLKFPHECCSRERSRQALAFVFLSTHPGNVFSGGEGVSPGCQQQHEGETVWCIFMNKIRDTVG